MFGPSGAGSSGNGFGSVSNQSRPGREYQRDGVELTGERILSSQEAVASEFSRGRWAGDGSFSLTSETVVGGGVAERKPLATVGKAKLAEHCDSFFSFRDFQKGVPERGGGARCGIGVA